MENYDKKYSSLGLETISHPLMYAKVMFGYLENLEENKGNENKWKVDEKRVKKYKIQI